MCWYQPRNAGSFRPRLTRYEENLDSPRLPANSAPRRIRVQGIGRACVSLSTATCMATTRPYWAAQPGGLRWHFHHSNGNTIHSTGGGQGRKQKEKTRITEPIASMEHNVWITQGSGLTLDGVLNGSQRWQQCSVLPLYSVHLVGLTQTQTQTQALAQAQAQVLRMVQAQQTGRKKQPSLPGEELDGFQSDTDMNMRVCLCEELVPCHVAPFAQSLTRGPGRSVTVAYNLLTILSPPTGYPRSSRCSLEEAHNASLTD